MENSFIKCGGCDIADFTDKPIFSAKHTLIFINDQPWSFQKIFQADSHFKKNQFQTHLNTKIFSLSTMKFKFWGKKTLDPWSIWMKNDLKEQKLNWFNLKKSFMGWSISFKLSEELRMLLKNNHSKFECCTTPLWLPRPLTVTIIMKHPIVFQRLYWAQNWSDTKFWFFFPVTPFLNF